MHLLPRGLRVPVYLVSLATLGLAFAADNLPLDQAAAFSDRDEKTDSTTVVKLTTHGGALEARWSAGSQTHGCYGGFSIPIPAPVGAKSILFSVRKNAGDPEPEGLTLSTSDRRRYRLPFSLLGRFGTEWTEMKVSLDDFQVPADDLARVTGIGLTVFKMKGVDLGDGKDGRFSLKDLRVSSDPVPSRRTTVVLKDLPVRKPWGPHGHGAWIYRESSNHVSQLLTFNAKAAVPIRHLFVYAGSMTLSPTSGSISPIRTASLAWFRKALPATVKIHGNFDAADGARLGAWPAAEQERLARTLCDSVNAIPELDGLHLDIEPYVAEALPFYVALKRHSSKPVSASVGVWDRNLMQVLDAVVLMGYDLANDPSTYRERITPMLAGFARDARAVGTPWIPGLPFVASSLEYEVRKHRKTGAGESSGFTQLDYATRAKAALLSIPDLAADPLYGGVGIWGFIDEGKAGVGPMRNEWGLWPTQISDDMWALIRTLP